MTFTPPNLATLWERINRLDEDLNTHLGRYKIPLSSSDEQPTPTTLLTLIARTNLLETSCDSDRTTQKEVIAKLVNELRVILLEGNVIKCQQATQILLGALLHRYFRLINEYKTYNEAAKVPLFGWSVYSWDVKDSKLFQGIRKVLQLPDLLKTEKTSAVLAEDLKKLDVTTIVTALECFQQYTYKNDHYKEFPHLNQPNFKPQLEEIIAVHKSRGATILKQYKAISFLQSFVKKLSDEHEKLKLELDKWLKILKKDHANLSAVSIETIEGHISAHIPDPFKEKTIDLLYTPFVKDELPSLDPEQLIAQLRSCNSKSASYLLTGVCSLILEAEATGKDLKQRIYKALGIADEVEKLSCLDKKYALTLLIDYNKTLGEKDKLDLDVEFFGDFAQYETQLSQLESRLIERQKELEEEASVVSATM
ncbi:hypothetical protein [Legionella sp. km772]|uniref:hypothetical protein n=1 Tax=Legionella sp. km772 TaxID=2498111 RepID=UPI000F8D8466|nr:hypothetical protein [Legionella sp. km772]RUR12375.1 hypothetical protein ELY15_05325 [Legionella sp. km772]